MKTIAVDFDGVVHKYSKGWHDGTIYDEPMPGALHGLEELMKKNVVFIHSSREPEQIQNWFAEQKFLFSTLIINKFRFWNTQYVLGISQLKLPASMYIDDRAVRFESWSKLEIGE